VINASAGNNASYYPFTEKNPVWYLLIYSSPVGTIFGKKIEILAVQDPAIAK
jgi:hypothetical protein